MVSTSELLRAVDSAFVVTGFGLAAWPDPHAHRAPLEEEYSRLLDPAKWRILGARAQAWLVALADAGLAVVERDVSVRWYRHPGTVITSARLVVPLAGGALPLVVASSRLESVDDAGVTLGVGDPAIGFGAFPDCGCDACDRGSQVELDELDRHLLGIVSGAFPGFTRSRSSRSVAAASRRFRSGEITDPSGHEGTGASWLGPA